MGKIKFKWANLGLAVALMMLFAMRLFAQDAEIDINVNKGGGWYTQPWVWIVGGAVFILLLVALLRGGKKE